VRVSEINGPVMLAVTNILRTPPARIGRLGEHITLPRTIEVKKLIAIGLGVLAGMILWVVPVGVIFGHDVTSLLVTATVTGFLGYLFVTWSPLRGESFGLWLGLSAETVRPGRIRIEGEKVRAYIGVAPLLHTASGPVRIRPGAIDVPAGSVDERGVPYDHADLIRMFAAETAGAFPPASFEGFEGFEDTKPLPRER